MNTERKVVYCEFLAFNNPREVIIDWKYAQKLYDSKIRALKNYPLIEAMSFVGIKMLDGTWILTNEVKE